MSKNEPASKPVDAKAHGFLVDAITAAGGAFIQGDGAGRIWYEQGGKAYAVVLTEPQAPLPDLTGKKKISTPAPAEAVGKAE